MRQHGQTQKNNRQTEQTDKHYKRHKAKTLQLTIEYDKIYTPKTHRCPTMLIVATTVCLKKNIPDIFSCNSRKYYRIFIIFGTHVTEKVSNQ